MSYEARYKNLNTAQKKAVDTTEGPVMVIAGPGTGKTELLSMRAANILRTTDTLPSSILCLTFTESGAAAMRERLAEIIGQDAYKVAIHTFHSFGSDVISRFSEYFYQGAAFRPADEISTYEVLREIFEELPHSSPIASQFGGEFTYLKEAASVISELKKSGLTSDELLAVVSDNERVLDMAERDLTALFAGKIAKTMAAPLSLVATKIAELPPVSLPPGITPLANVLALSIAHAVDEAQDIDSTKPLTAWRNAWLEKNSNGEFIFKDRKRHTKLRAIASVYFQYLSLMQERQLYDFDDMVLRTLHAVEVFDELRFALQEQYLYVMVDEFQDTNLSQMRLLAALANNPINEGAPNLMVVGDDDQAIYSFQGAEVSNILSFSDRYETTERITLTDNYRSASEILTSARDVISLGQERLERFLPDLDKTLTPHYRTKGDVRLVEAGSVDEERAWLAHEIKQLIKKGIAASDIVVLTRRHSDLVALLPFLTSEHIKVSYERRDNILDNELIKQLELLGRIIYSLSIGQHDVANSLLPELLAHSAWNINPETIWDISLAAHRDRKYWLEIMADNPATKELRAWLLDMAKFSQTIGLEPMIDRLVGPTDKSAVEEFVSPYGAYYFNANTMQDSPTNYLEFLGVLRTLRAGLRDYQPNEEPKLRQFLDYLAVHDQLGSVIANVHTPSRETFDEIHLMTAHKSKGLEFKHVFVYGAVDSMWGRRVRSRSRLIGYPENLPLAPAGDTYDERLRLFFVAMTRAKESLTISYSTLNDTGSALLPAEFLIGDGWKPKRLPESTTSQATKDARLAWYQPVISLPQDSMQSLLRSSLEHYKLSATHLGNFLDVTRGGPEYFLMRNLLRFPESMSPDAVYGSAIHTTLQKAHAHLTATHHKRPLEDSLQDFQTELERSSIFDPQSLAHYIDRGSSALTAFFAAKEASFNDTQRPELNFSNQQSMLGMAHLTGSLDLVDIDTKSKTITVTDYKTGKPSHSWQGKSDGEKIKLHRYRQQLLFYKLLVENSRDFSGYTVTHGVLQFVEPDEQGKIVALELEFDNTELETLKALIGSVWQHIQVLDLPEVNGYSKNFRGLVDFETDLLDEVQ